MKTEKKATVKINVTKTDIKRASANPQSYCPIDLAVARKLKLSPHSVYTGTTEIDLCDSERWLSGPVNLPLIARKFVLQFDGSAIGRRRCKPFSFLLEVWE